jgi:hypothetical protein
MENTPEMLRAFIASIPSADMQDYVTEEWVNDILEDASIMLHEEEPWSKESQYMSLAWTTYSSNVVWHDVDGKLNKDNPSYISLHGRLFASKYAEKEEGAYGTLKGCYKIIDHIEDAIEDGVLNLPFYNLIKKSEKNYIYQWVGRRLPKGPASNKIVQVKKVSKKKDKKKFVAEPM